MRRAGGLIAVRLDPLLAIFSVAGGEKKKREPHRLDTPHGFIVDVTQLLSALDQGDPQAASRLLPLVDDELRKLAAQRMAQERPGQTLQPTALVHEAYQRLA
jgi:hypothetical protein